MVWSLSVDIPYESERLGTGDESSSGPTAERAQLDSSTSSRIRLLPAKVAHAVQWVLPKWLSPNAALAMLVWVLSGVLVAVPEGKRWYDER